VSRGFPLSKYTFQGSDGLFDEEKATQMLLFCQAVPIKNVIIKRSSTGS